MTNIVQAYRGVVDKYIRDCVMAGPGTIPYHSVHIHTVALVTIMASVIMINPTTVGSLQSFCSFFWTVLREAFYENHVSRCNVDARAPRAGI